MKGNKNLKGAILVNAYTKIEAAHRQGERLRAEFDKRGVQTDLLANDFFAVSVDGNLHCKLTEYDFCVYLDKDKYTLQGIEKVGIPLFNGYAAIEACDDKMTTCLTLANCGIPMPLTLSGTFCYEKSAAVSDQSLDMIESALGYPLVVKECYGSCGKGVYLVRDRAELKEKSAELLLVPHLYQKFVSSSYGRDVRVIVIGKKALGAMLRESQGDFRSNVALGGKAVGYTLSKEEKELCEKVAALLNLEYCGIDLLFGDEGNMLVCEVNSNAFFDGFERATGKNVASAYAEYILSKFEKE